MWVLAAHSSSSNDGGGRETKRMGEGKRHAVYDLYVFVADLHAPTIRYGVHLRRYDRAIRMLSNFFYDFELKAKKLLNRSKLDPKTSVACA